jgi:hypothetical protein
VTTFQEAGRVLDKSKWFEQTEYEPHLGQAAVHYDDHRHRVLCNGRRWGKTLLGGKEVEPCAFILNRLGQPQTGWIVGPEYQDCEKEFRIVFNTFKKLGIDKVSHKFLNNIDNGNMHIQTRWGFDLECRSAKHPETLTGEGLDFVLMVEAGRQKPKTWKEYIRPALSDKRGWSLHSGVPEGATETSLLYSLWQRGQSLTTSRGNRNPWRSWRMPSWTNTVMFPGGRTDPEILDAEEDLTEDEFARQYGARFVERVGRVMQEWDDEVHLRDLKFERSWPLYMGIDYGYTNPFVILWIQVDPFNNVYVIREHRWQLKDTMTIAQEVQVDPLEKHMLQLLVAFYPDPAEPDDTETLRRLWRKPARSNTGGELRTRLNLIRHHLKIHNQHLPDGHADKQPRLFVDRRCTQLAWEMREGYRWPEHKSETKSESENPMDKDNHGIEALGRFMKGYMEVVGDARHTIQKTAYIGPGRRKDIRNPSLRIGRG